MGENEAAMADEEMAIGTAKGAKDSGSNAQVSIEVMLSTVLKKGEFLAVRPFLRDPLLVLAKPRLTIHEVLKWLRSLAPGVGRAGWDRSSVRSRKK